MSSEELQRIIETAQETISNAAEHRTNFRPTEVTPENNIQSLDEDATEDVISDMLVQMGVAVHPSNVPEQSEHLYPEEVTLNEAAISTAEDVTETEQTPVHTPFPDFEPAIEDGAPTFVASTSESSTEDDSELEQAAEEDNNRVIPDLPDNTAEFRETTSRFSGAEWFKIAGEKDIVFAGLGGIGSWAAFLLSRVHPRHLYLYDPDTIEAVNLSGQLYSEENIGNNKSTVLHKFIKGYSNYYDTFSYVERFGPSSPASDIMISGFDNMEARKVYFNSWKQHVDRKTEEDKKECLYIDARMSAEDIQILCMTGADTEYIKEYQEKWLFSDEEADTEVCSYKQTSFCAAIIGGLICNLFVNFCTNLGNPLMPRPLPFLTTYDASLMFLNVKS